MDDALAFGRLLKRYRAARDLTQEALAERAGCAVQTITKFERGARRPSRALAERLATVLEVPAAECQAFVQTARSGARPMGAAATPDTRRQLPAALPRFPTSFVGRERELAALRDLLTLPDRCLITVVGPGGVGKTRLVVEATAACSQFADGVAFAALAPVMDPAGLVPAIANALPMTFSGPADPEAQLLAYLQHKQLLLVLDNLEHLLSSEGLAVELLAKLLSTAPQVRLLVTSRERLHLQAEWVVELAGLPLPGGREPVATRHADAVVLFAERAWRVWNGFTLTAANLAAVVEICRLVDGIPLGLELAATWVRVLSCAEIATELVRGLDVLETPARDLPARHRSLRAVFHHSWRLLGSGEQQVLRKLAVFRGGFDRHAASEVAGASLPVLAALVDKSLLFRPSADRYNLHEVVRQYALEYLHRADEGQAAYAAHAHYFCRQAEQAEANLQSSALGPTLEQLEVEHDNLRAAWDWAVAHGEAELALRLSAALTQFWFFRGHIHEGRRRLEGALHSSSAAASAARAKALQSAGWLAWSGGDFEASIRLNEAGLALARQVGDPVVMASALANLGAVALHQTAYQRANTYYADALALQRQLGDRAGSAWSLHNLALIAVLEGEFEPASRLEEECLGLSRADQITWVTAVALNTLALIALHEGVYTRALSLCAESLALHHDLGLVRGIVFNLQVLACLAAAQGALDRAAQFWGAAGAALDGMGTSLSAAEHAQFDRYIDAARAQLGQRAFAAALAEGRAMSLEQAVAYALAAGTPCDRDNGKHE